MSFVLGNNSSCKNKDMMIPFCRMVHARVVICSMCLLESLLQKEYVFIQCLLSKRQRIFCPALRHPVRPLNKGHTQSALKQGGL